VIFLFAVRSKRVCCILFSDRQGEGGLDVFGLVSMVVL